jgi:UDP-GlcNAc:undecaprenyl-phosphate GlcNAc-1-phosphate transferase
MTLPHLLAFALSFGLSLLLVPFVRWLSFRLGKVSMPRGDRWHRTPTPTLGGIGMFAAFAISVLAISAWQNDWAALPWPLLGGSLLMFALGFLDDLRHLSPPAKLVMQILAASVVIFFGRPIAFFPWPILNIILTFLWLVGITNAINLLDNMDGLAGGIAFIAAGFLSYFFFGTGNSALLMLSLSLAGGILGFLVFNFPPARIFMGDSGSLFLGFTLAALAVAHKPRASDVFTVMGVPVLLFLLPIVDTTLVTITRLLRGQSPAQGGTDHTSHRLIAFGLTERQAVLSLYLIAILSGITGAVLEALNYDLSLVLVPILLIALSILTAYLGRLKVVTTYKPTQSNITRLMVNLTYRRRMFEMLLDFALIATAYYLAFWVSNGLNLENSRVTLYLKSLPLAVASGFISFYVMGVYRAVWRYVGVEDLLMYGRSAIGAAALAAIPLTLLFPGQFTLEVMVLFAVFLFLGLAASRASFRILDRIYDRQVTRHNGKVNVLIYGAEDAGEIALRWIQQNPSLGYQPLGFLDDDRLKWGRRIHGVSVLGDCDKLSELLESKQIDGIIISSPDLMIDGLLERLQACCQEKGVWLRVLKLNFELLE